MSQQNNIDPSLAGKSAIDGWTNIAYIGIGIAMSLATAFVTDAAKQAQIQQYGALILSALPTAAGIIGAGFQTIKDAYRSTAAGKAAQAQATPAPTVTTVGTPMFDNPEYGKVPQAQITAFNQPIAVMQNKLITPNPTSVMLNAATEMVSTPKGSVDYLMGELGETIDREYQHMLDVNPNLSSLERVQEVVSKYLGITLTPDDCKAVQAMIGLPEILHSYADKTILAGLWASYQAKQLGPAIMPGLMKRAYQMAREDVIVHAESKVQKAETDAEIKAALADIGLGEYAQKTYVPTGKQFYVNFNGGLKPLSVAAFFGLDPISMEPL